MELSILQKNIISAPYDKIVVKSCAGSGKTTILTEKVRQILRAGADPTKIAVITFTNLAAETLRDRLGADYPKGLFVGTIHALANLLLVRAGIKTEKVLKQERFDELFQMVEENPQCLRHYDWVLLDEAQDADEHQYFFLFEMLNPAYFFVVGDPRQTIYQFRGCSYQYMQTLSRRPGVKLFSLNENYRNGSNILNFARRIIVKTGLIDDSIPIREISGFVHEEPLSYKFILDEVVGAYPCYNNCAVLCRANAQLDDLAAIFASQKIPYESFKQGDLTAQELKDKMANNTIKLLTIHSSKGLEWKKVIVVGARMYNDDECNVAYVAATRARDKLIWMRPRARQKKKDFGF